MLGLTAAQVIIIHDDVIGPHELQGIAKDKSLDAAIGRIDTRMSYGLIGDIFDFAACYATFIASAHVFHDANKRTAFASMDTILALNGVELDYDTQAAGDMIIKIVTHQADENDLASWLRAHQI
jgi:death-on-curing protein